VSEPIYNVPAELDPDAVASALADGLVVEADGLRSLRRRHLDSFDWRLHRAGLTLALEDDRWRLVRLDDDAVEAEAPAGDAWPRFVGDFPTVGGLRKRLGKLLKMRAAIHLITVEGDARSWRVLNEDRKTVLRLELVDWRAERPAADALLRTLFLHPVRGYDAPLAAARTAASALGLSALEGPPLDALLRIVGIEPEDYSSRFEADLGDHDTALEAAVTVARTLLTTMRRNEAGLRRDIDTEFLHDFRVAVRRLRSALTVFRGVFEPEAVAPFRRDFAALGRLTGPLRDLDVYLLDEGRYRAMLPAALRSGLDPLFDDLRARRAAALAEVRVALDSAAYQDLVQGWQAFLAAPAPGPAAAQPVLDLARDRLRRRHRRMVKKGREIGPRTPDAALHRLRIQGKKLRYLLEFFASLFPADDVAVLVGHLKGLQDNLGEFNDLSVQDAMLREALETLSPPGEAALAEAAALGGLVTALDARRRTVRREFAAAFAAFTRPEVVERFDGLLAAEREAGT
jgi:CHAD domain-containing protein